jgi:hypothetical protein
MSDRFESLRKKLEDAVFRTPGESDLALRRAAAKGEGLPAALAGFVEKIRRHAYRVTDEDVTALKSSGHSEDLLFEILAAAALGASLDRLNAGLRAVRAVKGKNDASRQGR